MQQLDNGRWVFITVDFHNHALKYDKNTNTIIVGEYDVMDINNINFDFQFLLESTSHSSMLCPFVC